jgi:acyl-CoA synthetase (NDP forming)
MAGLPSRPTAFPVSEDPNVSVESASVAMVAEAEAKAMLRSFGIDVPSGVVVSSIHDVPSSLREPLVLKAVAPSLIHKSDAGGVRVGLRHEDLPSAAERMRTDVAQAGHGLEAYLVEEMAPSGREVVVGAVRTPGVGWVVMVGLGGVFVEILADVAFAVAPVASDDVRAMLGELRGAALLHGARGEAPVDVDALVQVVEQLAGPAGLLESLPDDVAEIDLNPVIVSPTGAVVVDARIVRRPLGDVSHGPSAPVPARAVTPADAPTFASLFAPRTVAVLGAKSAGTNGANLFIRNLVAAGYDGRILPVHPSAEQIEGLPASPSLAAVDGVVDYAYVALPAALVTDALAAGGGRVRFAQVVSSGFSETDEGAGLERELVERLRPLGTRVIGPNCLGTHSSAARLTFIPEAPLTPGGVAVVSQSGGLSVDILRLGAARGLSFHSVTSIGNGADVTPAELLEHLLDSPETTVIGLYLESLGAARSVLDVVRRREVAKPIVLLAGGRTADGSRAATSHTGALSGNHRLWPAIARQSGITLTDSLEDFVNVLLVMDTVDLDVRPRGVDAVLFGNGGGASVLAADALERHGLRTPRLPDATVARLDDLGLPPGNGLHNPIDAPAPTLAVRGGAIAEDIITTVLEETCPAVVITHLNVGIIQRNLGATHGDVTGAIVEAVARARVAARHACHHVLVLKTDGKPDTEEQIRGYAERARTLGLPVLPTFEDAAVAVQALLRHQARTAPSVGSSGGAPTTPNDTDSQQEAT